jgi:hypothetical protein
MNGFADNIKKLQLNPYQKWPVGTKFTMRYLDSTKSFEGVHHYVQSELEYVIESANVVRSQTFDGKTHKQSFSINNEPGLYKSISDNPSIDQAVDSILNIGGVNILTRKVEFFLDWIGEESGGTMEWKEWVWKDYPNILLRKENGEEWWAITSLEKLKEVDGKIYTCIESKSKSVMVDGYSLETIYYSPEVPGFVVERITEFYKKEKGKEIKLQFISHEKICNISLKE